MKIHLVSGKGGVGKSLFALGLARYLSKQHARVLLVELGEQSFYSHLLDIPTITYQPTTVPELGFDIARWDGTSALSEYVLHLLKVESLHRLFFENPVTRSLIDAAPGLKELAILGKITSGPPRNVGPKLTYDELVVDAYSSGHFFALLKAPFGMSETFRFGPMAEQSRSIMKSLNSPELTRIHLVTLPEELPFQETCEMLKQLPTLSQIKPQVWINKWMYYPELSQNGETLELAQCFENLKHLQEQYAESLKKISGNLSIIPFFFELDPIRLSDHFSKAISL